jgi:transposase InsO family protein
MAWGTRDVRDQRVEFVIRHSRGESISSLCREFEITRPTGYVWIERFKQQGLAGMTELSRRPAVCPHRTGATIERRVVELRRQRPDWGARKLAVLLEREGVTLPIVTVHRILLRHGLVLASDSHAPATQRFQRERPNELWQMDFKGQKGSAREASIGPLSVLDDHSRYLVALQQTASTRYEPVRERLEEVFRTCGVPEAMLMDHGVPWFNAQAPSGWTRLQVWLMRQGIRCCFSGVRHPQTQGKVERFHGALQRARRRPDGQRWLSQDWLDNFRQEYNHLRPHQALDMRTPASLWQPSSRAYRPNPTEWDYGPGAELRKVNAQGDIWINDRPWVLSRALASETVQLHRIDERILIYFCHTLVRQIDLGAQRSTAVDRWAPIHDLNM